MAAILILSYLPTKLIFSVRNETLDQLQPIVIYKHSARFTGSEFPPKACRLPNNCKFAEKTCLQMILDETYGLIKERYKRILTGLTIEEVRIGIYLTAVFLSDGSCGVAATLKDDPSHCSKSNRDFGDFTPNRMKGQLVTKLFESEKLSGIIVTVRLAVLNALSSMMLAESGYKILIDTDPIDLIDLKPEKTVTIVGAFHSYIKKIAESGNKLYVLELNEDALSKEQKQYYVPAHDYEKVLNHSDIVIVTGSTLVNNTIDNLLHSVSRHSQVIVTGPSSSIIPDILFKNHVDMIGATRVTNAELLRSVVSEAGTGYHLFKYCAQKICILNE
jgi:uncharacterized protein